MVKVAGIEWISEKHASVFAHHESLSIAVSEWCKAAIPRFNTVKWSFEQSVVCLIFLHTSRRAHDGIGYLCEQGLASEALSLVRKLFEAYVHAKFIRLSPEANTMLFVYHPLITEAVRKERLWRLKGKPPELEHFEGGGDSEYVAHVTELMSRVAEVLDIKKCEFANLERLAREWSGSGLLSMCKLIDRVPDKAGVSGRMFEAIYEGEFRDLCEYTHGTGSNLTHGITLSEVSVESDFRRTDTYVPHALIQGAKYYLWLLHDVAQVVNGEDGKKLYGEIVEPFLAKNRVLAKEHKMTTEIA